MPLGSFSGSSPSIEQFQYFVLPALLKSYITVEEELGL